MTDTAQLIKQMQNLENDYSHFARILGQGKPLYDEMIDYEADAWRICGELEGIAFMLEHCPLIDEAGLDIIEKRMSLLAVKLEDDKNEDWLKPALICPSQAASYAQNVPTLWLRRTAPTGATLTKRLPRNNRGISTPTHTYHSVHWNLRFERDGTEDIAVIFDASGDLFASRPFWLPEEGDPTPSTLDAVRLATAAPKLLGAIEFILSDANSTLGCEARQMLEAARDATAAQN